MSEPVLDRSLLPAGCTVLCAVSGGADSVCLLDLVRRLGDVTVLCAHFDHGIRGAESARDVAFVEALCKEWGVPFFPGRGDVPAYAAANGLSIETAARELRYAFLERTAKEQGADVIATAHNLNDNAETILFRMARGTGLRGLTGIPARRGRIVRPLLQTPDRRAVIERLLNERRPKYLASADVVVDAGAPTVVVVERICALRGEPIEKAKRKKPGNTSEKERPQKKRFRRRRRKKGTSPGTPQENS